MFFIISMFQAFLIRQIKHIFSCFFFSAKDPFIPSKIISSQIFYFHNIFVVKAKPNRVPDLYSMQA